MNVPLIRESASGIIYRKWDCGPSAKAVLLLVHGLGGHSGRWRDTAVFFNKMGISCYAIELQGFGGSPALKGHIDSFNTYYRDILSLSALIGKENPGRKVFLAGESMGALIAFVLAGANPGSFDGLVCISPAFKSRLKFSIWDYSRIFFFLLFFPRRQMKMPFDSAMCTADPSYQQSLDNDALEHRLATPGLLLNIWKNQRRSRRLAAALKTPLLFLLASDFDTLVDSKESRRLFNSIRNPDKELIQYQGMRHALSVEEGREKVFMDAFGWLEKRIKGGGV